MKTRKKKLRQENQDPIPLILVWVRAIKVKRRKKFDLTSDYRSADWANSQTIKPQEIYKSRFG